MKGLHAIFRISVILVFAVFFPKQGNAQVDSTYVVPFDQEFSVGTYSYYQYTMLAHRVNKKETDKYKPNSPVSVGALFTYKNFALWFGLGIRFIGHPEHGTTSSVDMQYHYFGRKILFDLFYQNYKGFYAWNKSRGLALYPEVTLTQYGLSGQYIFNHRKFSYQAAFDQNERQLKTAGSFLSGGGFYFNRIASDSSLVINNYQLSLSGGYAHTWIFGKYCFISAGFSLGIDLGIVDLGHSTKFEVSPSWFPRISVGRNGKKWSTGLSFVLNRTYVAHNDKAKVYFDTGYAQFVLIRRFDTAPKVFHQIKLLN